MHKTSSFQKLENSVFADRLPGSAVNVPLLKKKTFVLPIFMEGHKIS